MNTTLMRAVVALLPTSVLLAWSFALFRRARTVGSSLQLLGAGCLVMVALTHVCEALRLFPWMRWGEAHSAGHYVDLFSAVLGVALVPLGSFLRKRVPISVAKS
jgi:succinate dehydrogenase/fumarate reductase cytochrome b subunit